jgi:hypothetical protein
MSFTFRPTSFCRLILAAALGSAAWANAADTAPKSAAPAGDGKLQRLAPDADVWIDRQYGRLVLRSEVVFREGPLELFLCPKGTKEHESILACNAKAYLVHAGLLALGVEPGRPVVFRPEYRAAEGPEIDVHVYWKDAQGKQQAARGQDWIRNVKTGKALDHPWVFGGSGFWKDEQSGEEYYMAESGDLICVSNFPSATMDLPIESSQSNESLIYECYTDRIPPLGTPVTVTLTPRKPAVGESKRKQDQ